MIVLWTTNSATQGKEKVTTSLVLCSRKREGNTVSLFSCFHCCPSSPLLSLTRLAKYVLMTSLDCL